MRVLYIKFFLPFLLLTLSSEIFSAAYWFDGFETLHRGLSLPHREYLEQVYPSSNMLIERTLNIYNRDDNEIPIFFVDNNLRTLKELSIAVAFKGKSEKLFSYFKKKHLAHKKQKKLKIVLKPTFFKYINFAELAKVQFAHTHHRVEIHSGILRQNTDTLESFLNEVRPFLNRDDTYTLLNKIQTQNHIRLDEDVLPLFARKTVKTFTHFKGPNCFHAALAFQDPLIPSNSFLHPNRLKEYHWQMINYDELWRILSNGFYEVNAENSQLKFGDILVIFDKPRDYEETKPIDFRWIKHAMVYLFDEFTFSKGSKSANSTYTVNTLQEEVSTWRGLTENLAIKVFRKSLIRVKNLPYAEQHDWLY